MPQLCAVGHVQFTQRAALTLLQQLGHRADREAAEDGVARLHVAGPHNRGAQPGLPGGHPGELLAEQFAERVLAQRPLGVALVHRMVGAGDGFAVVGKDAGGTGVDQPLQPVGVRAADAGDEPVDLHVVFELGADIVGGVDDRVHPGHGAADKGLVGQITRGQLDVQPVQTRQRRVVGQDGAAHLVVALQQLPHQPAADLTGSAGDKDFHVDPFAMFRSRVADVYSSSKASFRYPTTSRKEMIPVGRPLSSTRGRCRNP